MIPPDTQEHATAWVLHPDARVRRQARAALRGEGFEVLASAVPAPLLVSLLFGRVEPPHLLLVPGPEEGGSPVESVLGALRDRSWPTHVVLLTEDVPWLRRRIRRGADAALDPRFEPGALREVVGGLVPCAVGPVGIRAARRTCRAPG